MNTVKVKKYLELAQGFTQEMDLPARLLISKDPSGYSTYYAPFGHINSNARIVICGITPGLQQARLALSTTINELNSGANLTDALASAKNTASFAGPMRQNLIEMLDYIGIQDLLGITSCESLFTNRTDLVHYTSTLRYPVLKNGKNYAGAKSMVNNTYLWGQVKQQLVEEISILQDAIWIPLGETVAKVFEKLVAEGEIGDEKVLFGLPHASELNAERIKYFVGKKDISLLSNKVNPQLMDARKSDLVSKVKRLRETWR